MSSVGTKPPEEKPAHPDPEAAKKPASAPVKKPRVVKALSGLRGTASLSVVILHFNSDLGASFMCNNYGVNEFGHLAVTFFFVLSAFLLTYRCLKEPKNNPQLKYLHFRGSKIPIFSMRWCAYIIRRVFRIYPCFLVALGIACFVQRYHGLYYDYRYTQETGALGPKQFVEYMFLYDVNSIFWTIPPEMEFYLILPIIVSLYEKAEAMDFQSGVSIRAARTGPDGQPAPPEFKLTRVFIRLVHLIGFSIIAWVLLPLGHFFNPTVNRFHITIAFQTFWVGSMVAIIVHVMEQYGYGTYDWLKWKPSENPPVEEKEPEESHPFENRPASWKERLQSYWKGVKKSLWRWLVSLPGRLNKLWRDYLPTAVDILCWYIILGTMMSFPYYQVKYFNNTSIPDYATHPEWYSDGVTGESDGISGVLIFLLFYFSQDTSFSRFFQWSALMWCGEVSFAIYLFHPIAVFEVETAGILGLDGVASIILLSVIIATAVHYLVELPGMNFGNYLIREIRKRMFPKPQASQGMVPSSSTLSSETKPLTKSASQENLLREGPRGGYDEKKAIYLQEEGVRKDNEVEMADKRHGRVSPLHIETNMMEMALKSARRGPTSPTKRSPKKDAIAINIPISPVKESRKQF